MIWNKSYGKYQLRSAFPKVWKFTVHPPGQGKCSDQSSGKETCLTTSNLQFSSHICLKPFFIMQYLWHVWLVLFKSNIGKCWLGIDVLDLKTGYKMYQLCKLGSAKHMRDSRVVGNITDFWTRMSGFIIQAPPLIRIYPWGIYLISFCLSFFTYKMDIIIISHEVITSIKWNNTRKSLKIHNKHSTNVSHYYSERNRNIKVNCNCGFIPLATHFATLVSL